MSTLTGIEAAAEKLPVEQKQALLLFLAERLRAEGAALPSPRRFGVERLRQWVTEDQADGKRCREGA